MSMFCKHEWLKLSETVTKSQLESSLEALSSFATGDIRIPPQLCNVDRKLIQIFNCSKCGKIKKYTTNI